MRGEIQIVAALLLSLVAVAVNAGASVDESALAICGKEIRKEIGVARYTTFDKTVGTIRQIDGNIQYFINARHKAPDMAEEKSFRAVCDGRGYRASVSLVAEGAWRFSTEQPLIQQLADIRQ